MPGSRALAPLASSRRSAAAAAAPACAAPAPGRAAAAAAAAASAPPPRSQTGRLSSLALTGAARRAAPAAARMPNTPWPGAACPCSHQPVLARGSSPKLPSPFTPDCAPGKKPSGSQRANTSSYW